MLWLSRNFKSLVGISLQGPCTPSGGFYVLFDEAHEAAAGSQKDEDEETKRYSYYSLLIVALLGLHLWVTLLPLLHK